jgi:hypothetical protein
MSTQPESGYLCFFTTLELSNFSSSKSNDLMILESNSAPGYYSKANFPVNERKQHDHHLYVVVKKATPCFQDVVLRKSGEIIRNQKLSIHASSGQLNLFNASYQCIRLRASELDHIYPLIEGLKLSGIEFLKHKKVKTYSSFIQHKKYIKFDKISDGVYQDVEVPQRYFIQIPRPVDFNEFGKLVDDIKYSCKYNHFDASLAYLNQGEQTFDFVAVYSDHCDKDRLKEFKQHIDRLVK